MDLNKRLAVITGQAPTPGLGTVFGPVPQPQPALRTLQRRGAKGEDKKLQTQTFNLTTAQPASNPLRVGLAGNVLAVVNSTFVTDLIYCRFGDNGPFIPLGPRLAAISGQPFDYLYVYWDASPSTLTLLSATENAAAGDTLTPIYR
jgi:hypothetical protein